MHRPRAVVELPQASVLCHRRWGRPRFHSICRERALDPTGRLGAQRVSIRRCRHAASRVGCVRRRASPVCPEPRRCLVLTAPPRSSTTWGPPPARGPARRTASLCPVCVARSNDAARKSGVRRNAIAGRQPSRPRSVPRPQKARRPDGCRSRADTSSRSRVPKPSAPTRATSGAPGSRTIASGRIPIGRSGVSAMPRSRARSMSTRTVGRATNTRDSKDASQRRRTDTRRNRDRAPAPIDHTDRTSRYTRRAHAEGTAPMSVRFVPLGVHRPNDRTRPPAPS